MFYGAPIPVVTETKFLGLVFDRKLTFAAHIKYLKDRCLKALNLLRVVAHKDWGADSATLLKLYRTHVRSKLDFGCVVYGSARPSALESLDRVQKTGLHDRRLWRVLIESKTQHCAPVSEPSIPHLYSAYTSKLGNCPSDCAARNLVCNLSSNFAQTLQTQPSTASSTLASVVCSKLDQALSQHLATGCNKTSWIVESI